MAPTIDATHASTAFSPAVVSSWVMQSLPFLFSSFSKQPFVASIPPSNLSSTLVTQVGSATLPGVSAVCSHLSNPAAFLDMHFVLPARHFACWAEAKPPHVSIRAITSAVTIERVVMDPPLGDGLTMSDGSVAECVKSSQCG